MRKKPIVPRNPLVRQSLGDSVDSLITAKQVFRLMRRAPDVPAYHRVRITRDLVTQVVYFRDHLTALGWAVYIAEHPGASSFVRERQPEADDVVDGAVMTLVTEYAGLEPRLDDRLVQGVLDAIEMQHVRNCFDGDSGTEPETAEDCVHRAFELGNQGQATAALTYFDSGIALEPDNYQAYLARASFRLRTNAVDDTALADSEAALRLAPSWPSIQLECQLVHSQVCLALGREDAACQSVAFAVRTLRWLVEDHEWDSRGCTSLADGRGISAAPLKDLVEAYLAAVSNVSALNLAGPARESLRLSERDLKRLNSVL